MMQFVLAHWPWNAWEARYSASAAPLAQALIENPSTGLLTIFLTSDWLGRRDLVKSIRDCGHLHTVGALLAGMHEFEIELRNTSVETLRQLLQREASRFVVQDLITIALVPDSRRTVVERIRQTTWEERESRTVDAESLGPTSQEVEVVTDRFGLREFARRELHRRGCHFQMSDLLNLAAVCGLRKSTT